MVCLSFAPLHVQEQQVHALEKGMQQAERTAGELHAAARSEMHALAGKSEQAQACVAEFKSIVRVLAIELQQQVNEVRAALLHREQRDANVSVAVSQAKILAASILNLSESELSEIMDANQMAETCEDEVWMQQLDIILDSQKSGAKSSWIHQGSAVTVRVPIGPHGLGHSPSSL
uniref:Uncharacterized protein n=1 Tax=Eptatretus burgeri TaxID=7764 RepID=A0A8C4Q8R6_EPTBU